MRTPYSERLATWICQHEDINIYIEHLPDGSVRKFPVTLVNAVFHTSHEEYCSSRLYATQVTFDPKTYSSKLEDDIPESNPESSSEESEHKDENDQKDRDASDKEKEPDSEKSPKATDRVDDTTQELSSPSKSSSPLVQPIASTPLTDNDENDYDCDGDISSNGDSDNEYQSQNSNLQKRHLRARFDRHNKDGDMLTPPTEPESDIEHPLKPSTLHDPVSLLTDNLQNASLSNDTVDQSPQSSAAASAAKDVTIPRTTKKKNKHTNRYEGQYLPTREFGFYNTRDISCEQYPLSYSVKAINQNKLLDDRRRQRNRYGPPPRFRRDSEGLEDKTSSDSGSSSSQVKSVLQLKDLQFEHIPLLSKVLHLYTRRWGDVFGYGHGPEIPRHQALHFGENTNTLEEGDMDSSDYTYASDAGSVRSTNSADRAFTETETHEYTRFYPQADQTDTEQQRILKNAYGYLVDAHFGTHRTAFNKTYLNEEARFDIIEIFKGKQNLSLSFDQYDGSRRNCLVEYSLFVCVKKERFRTRPTEDTTENKDQLLEPTDIDRNGPNSTDNLRRYYEQLLHRTDIFIISMIKPHELCLPKAKWVDEMVGSFDKYNLDKRTLEELAQATIGHHFSIDNQYMNRP